jgi:hypothetical protein
MAYSEVLHSISLEADSSIAEATGVPGTPGSSEPNSGKQYRFVKVTGAKTVGLATAAANEAPIGVLQNKPQVVGMAATVAIGGVSLVEAAGTITAGSGVKCDANGKAVAWVAGTDDENLRLGVAITAGASGALMSVLIRAL